MRLQGHLLQLHWLCPTHSYLPKGQVGAEIPPVCRPGFVHPEEGTLWATESLSYPNMQPPSPKPSRGRLHEHLDGFLLFLMENPRALCRPPSE